MMTLRALTSSGRPSARAAPVLTRPVNEHLDGRRITHGADCACLHCMRRRQLLAWRDHMLDAQREIKTERSQRSGRLEPLGEGAVRAVASLLQ